MRKIEKINQDFSLVEALISVGIVVTIMMGIYALLVTITKGMGESTQKLGAISLVNERMEILRSLPYEDVGILGSGWVPGPIPASETVSKNGFNYTVETAIRYVQDAFDGIAPADTVPNDYKEAEIKVSWTIGGKQSSVEFFSRFVPDGMETSVGGGTLVVNTTDSFGTLVPNANINILSIENDPPVNENHVSDGTGNLTLPGLAAQTYRITVSKEGYETARTYPNPPGSAFVPIDSDMLVSEGELNMKAFIIDQPGDLALKAANIADDSGIPGILFDIQGGRKIGNSPDTYMVFDNDKPTNSSGEIIYSDTSPGMYTILNLTEGGDALGNSQFQYVGFDVNVPFPVVNETKQVNFLFADKSTDSLVVQVKTDDADGNNPIEGAEVHVTGTGFDQTLTTGVEGLVYFPTPADPPTVMASGQYNVEVSASGYSSANENVTIDHLIVKEFKMTLE